jgi:hypothetical protein
MPEMAVEQDADLAGSQFFDADFGQHLPEEVSQDRPAVVLDGRARYSSSTRASWENNNDVTALPQVWY